ncbi:MAG: hypothetical protein P1V97_05395, partial [Planctomycetota bacterium]|nr:hypothetical protein [Planctomycetota bacterium]
MKSEIKQASNESASCSQDREQWIRRGIDQAIAANKSILQLIVSIPLTNSDPWRALPQNHDKTSFIAWHDPKRQLSLLARGQLFAKEAEGPDRFTQLHKEQVKLQAQRFIVSDTPLDSPPPLAFAGFAFAATSSKEHTAWKHWPNSLFSVPEEIIVLEEKNEQGKKCKIIINTQISKDSPNPFLLSKRLEEIEKELSLPLPNADPAKPAVPLQVL